MKRVRNYLLLGSNLSQIQLFWNQLYDVSVSRSQFEEEIGDGEIFDVYNTSTSQTVNERRSRSDHALNEVLENINLYSKILTFIYLFLLCDRLALCTRHAHLSARVKNARNYACYVG